MQSRVGRVLFWAPRVLGILFALFVSVFALDVIDAGYGPWETVGALLVHLVPSAILLVAIAAAWRRDGLGAVLFGGLAAFYVALASRHLPPAAWLGVAVPLAVVALLFVTSWIYRARSR